MATVSLDIGNYVIIADNTQDENYQFFAKLNAIENDQETGQNWIEFKLLFDLHEGIPVDNQVKVLSASQLSHIARLQIFDPEEGEIVLDELMGEYRERNRQRQQAGSTELLEGQEIQEIRETRGAQGNPPTLTVRYRNPGDENPSLFETKNYVLTFNDGNIRTFNMIAKNNPSAYFKAFDEFINKNGFQIMKYLDVELVSTFLNLKIMHTLNHNNLEVTPGECYHLINTRTQKTFEAMYIRDELFFVVAEGENADFEKNDLVDLTSVIDEYEFAVSEHKVEDKNQLLESINSALGIHISFGEAFRAYTKIPSRDYLTSQDFTDNWRKAIVYAVITNIPFEWKNIRFDTFPEKTILKKTAAELDNKLVGFNA